METQNEYVEDLGDRTEFNDEERMNDEFGMEEHLGLFFWFPIPFDIGEEAGHTETFPEASQTMVQDLFASLGRGS